MRTHGDSCESAEWRDYVAAQMALQRGERTNPGAGDDAVIEQAGKRAAELFEMAEDENWLGI